LVGDPTSERAAQNQSLYRSINENIRELNQTLADVTPLAGEWICECADTTCTVRINATLEEYETVRASGRTFIVSPGHVLPQVERIVAENDRFTTVEKLDNGGQVAEDLDPRNPAQA
jgi:hypothetical protein